MLSSQTCKTNKTFAYSEIHERVRIFNLVIELLPYQMQTIINHVLCIILTLCNNYKMIVTKFST